MSSYDNHADGDERVFALAAHLSPIIAMIISAGWLTFVGPLVVWLLARNRSSYVQKAAAGAFNFSLWAWLMSIIAWICLFTVVLSPVAIVLWVIAGILTIVCHCLAAWKAAHGQGFTYPAQIRILR